MAIARYLADQSALARLRHPPVAARLGPLIEAGLVATCPMVELEVLFSAKSGDEYEVVRADRQLGYEWLPMGDQEWDRALEVQRELAAIGQLRAVAIPDLLIAATAERHRVTVMHYDADFERVAAASGQPMEWVVPAGSVP